MDAAGARFVPGFFVRVISASVGALREAAGIGISRAEGVVEGSKCRRGARVASVRDSRKIRAASALVAEGRA